MEKKNVLGLGLLFLALLVIGGGIYYLYTEREKEIANNQEREELEELPPVEETESMPYDDFASTYEYLGDNTWDYKVTGTLPNPCYTVTIEPVVMESDPEQVSIKTKIQEPSPDEICTQVIQEVEETGTFSASEDAEIIHNVFLISPDTEVEPF
jgi:hypothetical protein